MYKINKKADGDSVFLNTEPVFVEFLCILLIGFSAPSISGFRL
jgi:hypothetical protein